MADWYFDSVNGSDSNDGHSPAKAKQYYATAGTTTGDRFFFKRGTEQNVSAIGVRSGSSATARAYYGAYGVAQVPYSIWKYSGAGGNMIINASRASYVDFEDMYFDMRNTDCRNALYLASQSTFGTTDIGVRRAFFRGSNSPSSLNGNGLNITRESTSSVWPTNITVEDCEFLENYGHGMLIIGSQNIIVRRSKFYLNGQYAPTGGHGFSAGALHTTASSGWTVTTDPSGKIWQRTLTGQELDVYYVRTNIGVYPKLRRTAGTQTTPAAGEFGVLSGVLYINVNSTSNPSGQSIDYAWGRCTGLLVENCEASENYWNTAASYHEGHGFAFDDYSDDSVFVGNKSHDNQGTGFSINMGDRNTLRSNIAFGNWRGGLLCNPTDDLKVYNNTFAGNNTGTGADAAEILFYGYSRNAVISNNIIRSIASYGISRETAQGRDP